MKKSKITDIPKSIVKGGGFIKTDLNTNEKLLSISPSCTVIGIKDLPHTLFATADFDIENLPIAISTTIYNVKKIILKDTFLLEEDKDLITIPHWIANFGQLECLSLENVYLDNLYNLVNLPLQHLIFKNIKCINQNKVIAAIKQFKSLKEISYDKSFPKIMIKTMGNSNLNIVWHQQKADT